jgi:hypothetical protein
LLSTRELDRTVVGDAVAHRCDTHHCDELLFIVVTATMVVTKAMHDNNEDL